MRDVSNAVDFLSGTMEARDAGVAPNDPDGAMFELCSQRLRITHRGYLASLRRSQIAYDI